MKIVMFFTMLKAFELLNAYLAGLGGFAVGAFLAFYAAYKFFSRERTLNRRVNKNEN